METAITSGRLLSNIGFLYTENEIMKENLQAISSENELLKDRVQMLEAENVKLRSLLNEAQENAAANGQGTD